MDASGPERLTRSAKIILLNGTLAPKLALFWIVAVSYDACYPRVTFLLPCSMNACPDSPCLILLQWLAFFALRAITPRTLPLLVLTAAVLGHGIILAQAHGDSSGRVFELTIPESQHHAPPGTPGSLDTALGDAWVGQVATVRTVVVQPDGKTLVLGDFSRISATARNHIARLNADGSLDAAFDPGASANADILSVAVAPHDKLIFGGNFTSYKRIPCHGFARVNADGSPDADFHPASVNCINVRSLAVQPDGKVLLAGDFTSPDGASCSGVTRLNADGSLDMRFNSGGRVDLRASSLAVQPDGKILIGGDLFIIHGTPRNGIVRLNANGSLDADFDRGIGVNLLVSSLALQKDGKILIGGEFESYDDIPCHGIARLNANGSLDTTFDPGTGAWQRINSVAPLPDGKVLIGGFFEYFDSVPRRGVARLNADGRTDTTFDPGSGARAVFTVAALPGGKIIFGGDFADYNGSPCIGIARANADGKIDAAFKFPAVTRVGELHAVIPQPDGKVLLGGRFDVVNGTARCGIARINTDGTLDSSFDAEEGTNEQVSAVALRSNGELFIGGRFTAYNGTSRDHVALLNANGRLDTSFNPQLGIYEGDDVHCIAVQADGRIIIGGQIFHMNGAQWSHVARLHADGSVDPSFHPEPGLDIQPESVVLQPDGKVLCGGYTVEDDKTGRRAVVRLHDDGSLDGGFNAGSGMDGIVNSITLQRDGKIIIGGAFTLSRGTDRHNFACLNADGSLDAKRNPGSGANNYVNSVAMQPDGKILLAGQFSSINGVTRNRIARLNVDGDVDDAFYPGAGTGGVVYAIAAQSDGKVLIGGEFSEYDDASRCGVARLNGDRVSPVMTPTP